MYGEYDRLLECLQVRYTDAIADGNGEGHGDDQLRAEDTIDAAESRGGSYDDWGFHQDYCVEFRQLPTLRTSYECKIG
jgi:hypothetical protein